MQNHNIFGNIQIEENENISPDSTKGMDIDVLTPEEQYLIRYKQNTKYRKYFAIWVMCLVPAWLLLVLALLCCCAFELCSLPSSVLSVLLATTTANVLGLAYIVLKGIFAPWGDKRRKRLMQS